MKVNIFLFGCLIGLLASFFAYQLDEKNMIEKGYIHNIFLGNISICK